jgi:hypothetical protein
MDADHSVSAVYLSPTIYTLTVNSSPSNGASITVSPADRFGAGTGPTPRTLSYLSGTSVTLTAPSTFNGNNFSHWQEGTANLGPSRTLTVTMGRNYSLTAVYVAAPIYYSLSVSSSTPNRGLPVTVSPADRNGASNGATPFSRSYLSGTEVTLTVSATYDGWKLQRWELDGTAMGNALTLKVPTNANHSVRAVYRKK